jgi:hypothetical protein
MRGNQTIFFALFDDIEPILKKMEATHDLRYYEMGMFDSNVAISYHSIFEIPDIGFVNNGDWSYDRRLLILSATSTLEIRGVPQRKGGIKYVIDPLSNPVHVALQLGGIYTGEPGVLVAGDVSTLATDSFSLEVYKSVSLGIKKSFIKKQGIYVGKEAAERLRSGWRLVFDEGRDKAYDLV